MLTKGHPYARPWSQTTKRQFTRTDLHELIAGRQDRLERDVFALSFGSSGILPVTTGIIVPGQMAAGTANDSIRVRPCCGLIYNTTDEHSPIVDFDNSYADIPVENLLGRTYRVGLRQHQVPRRDAASVVVGPRRGRAEYVAKELRIGELGHPDTVSVNVDDTYDLDITTIMQAGGLVCDHGDRACYIWLEQPLSPAHEVAIWAATAVYSAGHYTISDIPPTALGQSAGSVSTTVANYWVQVVGPTVSTADLSADDDYLYLGSFSGAGLTARSGVAIGAISTTGVVRHQTLGSLEADLAAHKVSPIAHDASDITWTYGGFFGAPEIQTCLRLLRAATPIAVGIFKLADGVDALLSAGDAGWNLTGAVTALGGGRYDLLLDDDPPGGDWSKITVNPAVTAKSGGSYQGCYVQELTPSARGGASKKITVALMIAGAPAANPPADDSEEVRLSVIIYDAKAILGMPLH